MPPIIQNILIYKKIFAHSLDFRTVLAYNMLYNAVGLKQGRGLGNRKYFLTYT